MTDWTAKKIATWREDGNWRVSPNLYLRITGDARSWSFRFTEHGKEKWRAIGPCRVVSYGEAKAKRDLWGSQIYHRQPIGSPRIERHSLGDMVEASLLTLTNGTTRKTYIEWQSTMAEASSHFGNRPINDILLKDVAAFLRPIWNEKPVKASRVRGQLQAIFDYAKSNGYMTGDNPAELGLLIGLLGKRNHKIKHRASLGFGAVPGLYAKLQAVDTPVSKAIRFIILTAARLSMVLKAKPDEFSEKLWSIPANRMKTRKEFTIPLTRPMLELLPLGHANPQHCIDLLRELSGNETVTIHGFRADFRDWAISQKEPLYPDWLIEDALAHSDKKQVVAAYRRDPQLERRRELMGHWNDFVHGNEAVRILAGLAKRRSN